MPTVVCYGDSNTWGYNAATGTRHPKAVRWTGVLAATLGPGVDVAEEGLNGRTTVWDDPYVDGRNGRAYLDVCLRTNAPIDVFVLMLGTNDLKTIFGRAATEIAAGVDALLRMVAASGAGPDGAAPRLVVVAPVPLGEITDGSEIWGFGDGRDRSLQLARLYATVARSHGAAFVDAGSVAVADPADAVHLDAAAHAAIGLAVAEVVRGLV